MARKFTYVQQETLRKKALEALREMIEKKPTEAQQNLIKSELSRRYPGYEQLYDAMLVMQAKYNEVKRAFDEIIRKSNDFLQSKTNGYGISRSDKWGTNEKQPVEDFKKFIDAKTKQIAREKGYLVELSNLVNNLLVENITMADTRGKEMSEILQDVIQKTFADINKNRENYIIQR